MRRNFVVSWFLVVGLLGHVLADSELVRRVQEVRDLRRELLDVKEEKLRADSRLKVATLTYDEAVEIRDRIAAERVEQIHLKNKRDEDISQMKMSPEDEQSFQEQQEILAKKEAEFSALRKEYEALYKKHETLVEVMSERGLGPWLKERGRKVLPPTAMGVVTKTGKAIKPVIKRVAGVVDVNRKMARGIERRVNKVVPSAGSGFVNRSANYFVVLVPLLAFALLGVRLAKFLGDFSVPSVSLGLCLLFGGMAFSCFTFVMTHGRDPILVLQLKNDLLLAMILLVVAGLYCSYLTILSVQCYNTKDPIDYTELAAATFVAYHFFTVAWRRAMLDERPTIHPVAYILYLTIFGLVAYRRWAMMSYKLDDHEKRRKKKKKSRRTSDLDDSYNESLLPLRSPTDDGFKKKSSSRGTRRVGSKYASKTDSPSSWLFE